MLLTRKSTERLMRSRHALRPYPRIGRHHGTWRDVAPLERHSTIAA
ncbi:hypothetical protein ABT120_47980 [Nonomuraea angiospora]